MSQNGSIIQVENLSKKYLVGHETARRARYRSLRETLARQVRNFGRKALDMAQDSQPPFWR